MRIADKMVGIARYTHYVYRYRYRRIANKMVGIASAVKSFLPECNCAAVAAVLKEMETGEGGEGG